MASFPHIAPSSTLWSVISTHPHHLLPQYSLYSLWPSLNFHLFQDAFLVIPASSQPLWLSNSESRLTYINQFLYLMNLFYEPFFNANCGSSTVTNPKGKTLRLAQSLRSRCHWVGYFCEEESLPCLPGVFWHSLVLLACKKHQSDLCLHFYMAFALQARLCSNSPPFFFLFF